MLRNFIYSLRGAENLFDLTNSKDPSIGRLTHSTYASYNSYITDI